MTGPPDKTSNPAAADDPSRQVFVSSANARRLLWLCLALSLAAHAGIAVAVFNRPIGWIDPSLLHSKIRIIRLQRATYQMLHATMPGQGAQEHPNPAPNPRRLSEQLLKIESAPLGKTFSTPTPAPAPEKRSAVAPKVNQPASPLPGHLFQSLATAPPGTLTLGNGSGGNNPGASSAGAPGSSATGSALSGSTQARRLLAHAGLGLGPSSPPTPYQSPPGSGLQPLPAAAAVRQAPSDDRRLLMPDTGSSPIDFARLVLGATTRLKIPAHLDSDFDYYLSRYKPDADPGYFRVDIAAKRSLRKLVVMHKNVVFILDTSGSIPANWVRQATRGIVQALPALNPGDKFNIVLFNANPTLFDPTAMRPATEANLQDAAHFLYRAKSGGYTDVNAALRRLLVPNIPPDRVYDLILISDGKPTRGVMDTRQLINLITRENSLTASIYCIGIGEQQNHQLLDFLAYRNKGFSRFVNDNNHTAQAISDLVSRLRYPLIKNVRLAVAGVDPGQVFPRNLPDVHQGERFSIFGRYTHPGTFTVRITGTNNGRQVDFSFTRNLSLAPKSDASLAHDWAFWKLHHLYSEIMRHGGNAQVDGVERQIKHLRKKYHLKTLY